VGIERLVRYEGMDFDERIGDVLDSFPKDCEAVITLGPNIFNRLTKNMSADINCVDDQVVITSMLSRKISCPLECQYMFVKTMQRRYLGL
jgi:hypothetical protein